MIIPFARLTLTAAVLALSVPIGGLSGSAAWAQAAPAERVSEAPECAADAGVAEPATQPDASEDSTAAENTGTTGWSGGTGGSQLGTNIQGAVESSPTWQPPTARGLDLAGTAEDQPAC
ncbi:hypothetical protein CP157_03465 (plasmid) [Paracoccus marcusii]|uniref:hypothetical protein n=1 Tax=Paracoccus marcusii TaxID=59779 RepID=UPI001C3CBB3E|nr:hypothetical protein [Paracoccus marcusii]QXI65673.1 hypothetical protein CP157_03465 [Paracoccus marcusii]